jgi:hypothetical protein
MTKRCAAGQLDRLVDGDAAGDADEDGALAGLG